MTIKCPATFAEWCPLAVKELKQDDDKISHTYQLWGLILVLDTLELRIFDKDPP